LHLCDDVNNEREANDVEVAKMMSVQPGRAQKGQESECAVTGALDLVDKRIWPVSPPGFELESFCCKASTLTS